MGSARQAVVASAARTSSGQSSAIDLTRRPGSLMALAVDLTAVGGDADETLDLTVEWSQDATTWFQAETADAFTQLTQPGGATSVVKAFTVKAPQYRVVWAIAGTTPTFTFSIDEFVTS